MSKQLGYERFDGQIRWFVKFKIPLTRDKSWRLSVMSENISRGIIKPEAEEV